MTHVVLIRAGDISGNSRFASSRCRRLPTGPFRDTCVHAGSWAHSCFRAPPADRAKKQVTCIHKDTPAGSQHTTCPDLSS